MPSQTRDFEGYLVVKPKGYFGLTGRLALRAPSLDAGEIAIKVRLKVPDALFRRTQLQAQIVIPADSVTPPILDAKVIDNVREVLEQKTGLDILVSMVEPG